VIYQRTLFINPPSWQGFDGGAGSRYQARREIRSFWFPTWLAQPAALIEGSRLVDAPPHDQSVDDVLSIARDYELVVIHTSAPTLRGDARLAEALKSQNSDVRVGFVGAQAAVLPDETLAASEAIDFVARKEFDYTCRDVAVGLPLEQIDGLSFRRDGKVIHTRERALIENFDELPSVMDVVCARPRDRALLHRLPQAPVRLALHRARLSRPVLRSALATDSRRPQIPSAITGGGCS
jgi:hypothetical protein